MGRERERERGHTEERTKHEERIGGMKSMNEWVDGMDSMNGWIG